jgi:hypothetical protein
MPRPIAELFGDVASIVRECLGGVARFPPAEILQRLRQAPVPYVFGEVRVATLALLTFTALSGLRSCGVVITLTKVQAEQDQILLLASQKLDRVS